MQPGKFGVREQLATDELGVAGHQIDHAGRQARLAQELVDVVGRKQRVRRRLPDHRVAEQSRRGRKIAGDGREIEGGDRVDEAVERAQVELVLDAFG